MRKMAPESRGRAPTIDTASGWALAKAFTLWRTVGPGGAAAGSSKAPMARVLRAREKSGRRRNMAASRSALKGGRRERRPVALCKFGPGRHVCTCPLVQRRQQLPLDYVEK